MKSILSVGMDVHKNSFSLCAYDGYTGEIVSESTFASDVKLVIKFIETLKSRYENDVEIKCGYEAGCLGYSLYKSLGRTLIHGAHETRKILIPHFKQVEEDMALMYA